MLNVCACDIAESEIKNRWFLSVLEQDHHTLVSVETVSDLRSHHENTDVIVYSWEQLIPEGILPVSNVIFSEKPCVPRLWQLFYNTQCLNLPAKWMNKAHPTDHVFASIEMFQMISWWHAETLPYRDYLTKHCWLDIKVQNFNAKYTFNGCANSMTVLQRRTIVFH